MRYTSFSECEEVGMLGTVGKWSQPHPGWAVDPKPQGNLLGMKSYTVIWGLLPRKLRCPLKLIVGRWNLDMLVFGSAFHKPWNKDPGINNQYFMESIRPVSFVAQLKKICIFLFKPGGNFTGWKLHTSGEVREVEKNLVFKCVFFGGGNDVGRTCYVKRNWYSWWLKSCTIW